MGIEDSGALSGSLAAAAWIAIGAAGLLRPASLVLASRVLFPAGGPPPPTAILQALVTAVTALAAAKR